MAANEPRALVVWVLGTQRYALPVAVVERIVPAMEVTSLPDAPDPVCGVVNLQGRLVPVVDMRRRLGWPERELELSDQLVLARSARRWLGFFVDAVQGVIDPPPEARIGAETIAAEMGCIAGVVKLADGLILIHDLERLLSSEQQCQLDDALAARVAAGVA
jgi:purine-binding chemotaxis protein CheW